MKDKPLKWYITEGEKAGEIQTWSGLKEPRGYAPFVSGAVKACAEMTDPPISNSDSLRALKTVFSIYAAATSRRTVRI